MIISYIYSMNNSHFEVWRSYLGKL